MEYFLVAKGHCYLFFDARIRRRKKKYPRVVIFCEILWSSLIEDKVI